MKKSQIVQALADIASQGKYKVSVDGARKMNDVFIAVAKVINELEAEESISEDSV